MAGASPVEPRGYDADGDPVPWRAFAEEAARRLRAAGFASHEIDARRIVEQASGFEGGEYHLGLGELATKRGVVAFDAMLERRLAGEPLQYVVGRWGFRQLDLMVDARVLIPRPETEIVAGVAIDELARQAGTDDLHAVDLGTGSGAIGLSLAVEAPATRVTISDASPDALAVARANLTGIGRAATRVRVTEGSWFDALAEEDRGSIAVVVSNPPYVATADDLPEDVAGWEPAGALVAGPRGTEALEHLIDGALVWLRPGGALVLEMAPHQTAPMAERAATGGFAEIDVVRDLAGRDRLIRARRPT